MQYRSGAERVARAFAEARGPVAAADVLEEVATYAGALRPRVD
jgi:hypothetical protein